ncbi:hypothetical protein GO308_03375 [Sphingomonas sp. SFZ2018-12]|uniref:hypothetical protein n=1 Tax=Sphingomonas sp. SFZ2018-12 TaxID=2683197 RepID=UPI001F11635B|nr:hypothetical protein [Sphingomonas sp. SFZ2018-12]MCH4892151.1 hypothetical protein [Sphingomonas sp. SFZ2018-12]
MKTFDDIGEIELDRTFGTRSCSDAFVQTRLYKMIDYAKDRFHWYEDQREKKLGLAIGMVTLSGVSLTLLVNSLTGKGIDPSSVQFRLICIIQLLLTATAFGVVVVYLRGQNLIYTHRQGLNSIFSWYGYGVPPIASTGLIEYLIFGRFSDLTLSRVDEPALNSKRNKIIEGYEKFTSKVVPRLASPYLAVNEDIQQVYILQVFQVISRENLQQMVRCLKFGGISIAVSTFTLICTIIIHGIPVKV